jgi:hypothetical protein
MKVDRQDYEPKKYRSYLEQLGIAYPNLTTAPAAGSRRLRRVIFFDS